VSFIVCVVLYAVFRFIVVLFCVMCVNCLLCLIVLPLPPGKTPFAVKINNNNNNNNNMNMKPVGCEITVCLGNTLLRSGTPVTSLVLFRSTYFY
jgi:uncharacterized sodium:solute symporter family permease YidK